MSPEQQADKVPIPILGVLLKRLGGSVKVSAAEIVGIHGVIIRTDKEDNSVILSYRDETVEVERMG